MQTKPPDFDPRARLAKGRSPASARARGREIRALSSLSSALLSLTEEPHSALAFPGSRTRRLSNGISRQGARIRPKGWTPSQGSPSAQAAARPRARALRPGSRPRGEHRVLRQSL